MLCSYLQGNYMLSHQLNSISDCFPCGRFATSKPATQHLQLATFITISTIVSLNRPKFMIFELQLHSKRKPIDDRIQRIRELFQSGRGWSYWQRNNQVAECTVEDTKYSDDIFFFLSYHKVDLTLNSLFARACPGSGPSAIFAVRCSQQTHPGMCADKIHEPRAAASMLFSQEQNVS